MSNEIPIQNEKKAKLVKAVASEEQKKVLNDMHSGTEYLFLMQLREPITQESIDYALMIMVNSVEGDVSQLEEEHAAYALKKGWLKNFQPQENGKEAPNLDGVKMGFKPGKVLGTYNIYVGSKFKKQVGIDEFRAMQKKYNMVDLTEK